MVTESGVLYAKARQSALDALKPLVIVGLVCFLEGVLTAAISDMDIASMMIMSLKLVVLPAGIVLVFAILGVRTMLLFGPRTKSSRVGYFLIDRSAAIISFIFVIWGSLMPGFIMTGLFIAVLKTI